MDSNLTIDCNAQKQLQEQKQKEERTMNAWIFKKLAPASILYTIIYTICIFQNTSGITMPVWVAATIGYACYAISIAGKNVKKDSRFLIVVMLLLGVSTFATGNPWIITMNYMGFFLLLVCFLLKNLKAETGWDFGRYLMEFIVAVFGALGNIGTPFADGNAFVKTRQKKEDTKVRYVVFGILLALPCLLFLGMMLMSADMVFADMMDGFFGDFRFSGKTAEIGLMLSFGFFSSYCGVRYLTKNEKGALKEWGKQGEPVLAITVTAMIAVLYAVFCGIQILYLFIGKMQLPEGLTYAKYARSGFFQLLFVCILNLILVLSVEKYFKKHRVLDIILLVISACTMIMTASSAWRMLLYIGAYHLTFLRIAVLAALAVIALLLGGIVAYILRPAFPLVKYGVVVVSVAYLLFAFSHVDYFIASYNLAQMDQQKYETMNGQPAAEADDTAVADSAVAEDEMETGYSAAVADYGYIASLSTDAAPAIYKHLRSNPAAGRTPDGFLWKEAYFEHAKIERNAITWRNFNVSRYVAYRLFRGWTHIG